MRDLTFGQKLRLARKEAKMTQQELAEKLGVTQANISVLENRENPELETLVKIAKALDMEIKITGDGVEIVKKKEKEEGQKQT